MHQWMELYYLHHGTCKVIIENQITVIGPGTLLFFPPFQLHGMKVENNSPGALVRSVFEFDPLAFEPYVNAFSSLQIFFYNLWKNQFNHMAMMQVFEIGDSTTTQLEHQFSLLNDLSVSHTVDYEEQYALTILMLLKLIQPIWSKHFETPIISNRPQTNAEFIMEWIDSHFKAQFCMEELSKDLHLSEKHISTLFRKATGTKITEYLMARRLKQACRLLANTTESIENIAYEVGLTNVSYFCQFFKKKIGISPMQFRKNHNNNFPYYLLCLTSTLTVVPAAEQVERGYNLI